MTPHYAVLFMLAAAACGDDTNAAADATRTVAADAGTDASDSEGRAAEIDFAKLSDFPIDELVGLYHLTFGGDAINLELGGDHHFRWSLEGCDISDHEKGRFKLVTPTKLVLAPEEGHDSFTWSTIGVRQETSVEMDVDASGKLFEPIKRHGVDMQIWEPGGVCPICAGGFGPTGKNDCDEPNFED